MQDRDFFSRHSAVTDPRAARFMLGDLSPDLADLTRIIGGVMLHRDATPAFGFELPAQRRAEAELRYVSSLLSRIGGLTDRPPHQRLAVTCRDFVVLFVAVLREQGRPARARVGFADYFTPNSFDDHWVAETWVDGGWRLVDVQLASAAPGTYTDQDVDPLDVSRTAFLVAGQAWGDCRGGRRNPLSFGVPRVELRGMGEVQGNLIRDLAALNAVETLPWDDWGLICTPHDQLGPADMDLMDRVAAISAAGGPLDSAMDAFSLGRLTAPRR